ncbi:MAG: hypothetical protein M1822_002627 [Bathelium mastoideum]|nr:MAG: hypothetical protein M1822_002627 [Bathelium mastoideum]
MDASAHLRGLGWRGPGHSLDLHDQGIKKPILAGGKQDNVGLGGKHDYSDQWWLRAFDEGLKSIGTGQQSVLSQIQKNGAKHSALYRYFVKGSTLVGTISNDSASPSPAVSKSSTPPSSIEISHPTTKSLPSGSVQAKPKYTVPFILTTEAVGSGTRSTQADSQSESNSDLGLDTSTSESESTSNSASRSQSGVDTLTMSKANKKRKAQNGASDAEKKTKKKKRAVSGNNGALAVPAATIVTFEGAAALPDGPLPHAQAEGQSQSTGVDGVQPGEYGPNGYLYDPKPQKKAPRAKTEKELKQEQMRKWKREKRQERKVRNQQKDAEMKRFHKERKQKALLEELKQKDPERYANVEAKDLVVQTKKEEKADKKVERDEKKEEKKLYHRMLARQKKQNETQLKTDVVNGMDIEAADLSNKKRRMAERLRARLDRVITKHGGPAVFTLQDAAEEIETKRVQRKEQRQRKKEVKQQERKEKKAERAKASRENQRNKTNWQKERDDRLRAAALGVPYDPAMTGANAVAFKALHGQRPLPAFQPPNSGGGGGAEAGAAKLQALSDEKRKQYEARAREKGVSVEAYAARRAEKKEQKHTASADLSS